MVFLSMLLLAKSDLKLLPSSIHPFLQNLSKLIYLRFQNLNVIEAHLKCVLDKWGCTHLQRVSSLPLTSYMPTKYWMQHSLLSILLLGIDTKRNVQMPSKWRRIKPCKKAQAQRGREIYAAPIKNMHTRARTSYRTQYTNNKTIHLILFSCHLDII